MKNREVFIAKDKPESRRAGANVYMFAIKDEIDTKKPITMSYDTVDKSPIIKISANQLLAVAKEHKDKSKSPRDFWTGMLLDLTSNYSTKK